MGSALPTLSSDFYRYLWDGALVLRGFDPYVLTPLTSQELVGDPWLFGRLGWVGQYTIYPPVAELLFVAAYVLYAALGPLAAKLLFTLPWIATLVLLRNVFSRKLFVLLMLNPFFTFEVWYAAHLDGWIALLLVLFWWYMARQRVALSAVVLALATAVKIYPALFAPFATVTFWREGRRRAAVLWALLWGACSVVLLAPLALHGFFFIHRFGRWVEEMQFNASVYAFVRYLLEAFSLAPSVAPQVSVVLLGGCLLWLLSRRVWSTETLLLALGAFFLFSSVVYPWYTLAFVPLVFVWLGTFGEQRAMVRALLAFVLLQWLLSLTYISEWWSVEESVRVQLYTAAVVLEYVALAALVIFRRYVLPS